MSSMRLPRDPRTPTGDRRTATGERVAGVALDYNKTMSAGLPVFRDPADQTGIRMSDAAGNWSRVNVRSCSTSWHATCQSCLGT